MIQRLENCWDLKKRPKTHKILDKFLLGLKSRTHIMGILNRTPDSFYDGGRYMDKKSAVSHIYKMIDEGADVIDIGGQSTRPGSNPVPYQEELERVIPIIEEVASNVNIPISIDTYNHIVAEEAIKNGASIVNDITGLKGDPEMAGVIAKYDVGAVLMHIKDTPKTMQDNPTYKNLIGEIIESLNESIKIGIEAGISPQKMILDPGIGFGKTIQHNLDIINRLKEFKMLGKPILIGVSRKSFIYKTIGSSPDKVIFGTAAACAICIANGADILRVHDVKEIKEVAKIIDAILGKATSND